MRETVLESRVVIVQYWILITNWNRKIIITTEYIIPPRTKHVRKVKLGSQYSLFLFSQIILLCYFVCWSMYRVTLLVRKRRRMVSRYVLSGHNWQTNPPQYDTRNCVLLINWDCLISPAIGGVGFGYHCHCHWGWLTEWLTPPLCSSTFYHRISVIGTSDATPNMIFRE